MSRPRASVLLPVRDGSFLPEALRSLGTQTFESFEVCLELDGADEETRAIAREASRADGRIRVRASPPRGIVAALNAAAARARATLFVRMDADDVCAPDRLERLVELAAKRRSVGFLASRVTYVSEQPLSEGLARYETWINRLLRHDEIVGNRFVECPMPHPAWAVRRRVFEALVGYRDGAFPEDYDFFLRAVDAGVRFEKVDAPLLFWRDRPDRLSRRDPRYALRAFFELKLGTLVPLLARDGRDVGVVGTGKAARRWRRRLGEAGLPVVSLADVPRAPDTVVLVAVGGAERDRHVRALEARGYVHGVDVYGVQ